LSGFGNSGNRCRDHADFILRQFQHAAADAGLTEEGGSMIKHSPLLCVLLASGSVLAQTAANGPWRNQTSDCVPSRHTKCVDSHLPPTGTLSQPISAAKSDAIKKRQLADMIEMNKDSLVREQAALMAADPRPADKRL
jgi:hypothetical protein